MILDLGDYRIKTDDRQFIVQKKKIIQEGRMTKAENVGKEVWQDAGYFSKVNSAFKFLAKNVLLDNDDLVVIKDKLDRVEAKIDEFTRALKES